MGLKVQPPHVNRSEYRFTVADDGSVRYGLGAVKGVGQGAVDMIVATRQLDGAYESLDSLCQRVDAKRIGRRAFEALTRAGAVDGLGPHRAAIFAGIPDALARAEQRSRDLSTGQVDLFGAAAPACACLKISTLSRIDSNLAVCNNDSSASKVASPLCVTFDVTAINLSTTGCNSYRRISNVSTSPPPKRKTSTIFLGSSKVLPASHSN